MNPVSGGWTSHKMRSDDYEGKLRAAQAQSGSNSYIQGVQSVMDDGAGTAIQNTRSKYGNVNLMPNEVMQGQTSNFAQKDIPGNQPLDDIPNQTGRAELDTSSTAVPQEDPQEMETDALDKRLAMYAKAGQGFSGMNDRSRGA